MLVYWVKFSQILDRCKGATAYIGHCTYTYFLKLAPIVFNTLINHCNERTLKGAVDLHLSLALNKYLKSVFAPIFWSVKNVFI